MYVIPLVETTLGEEEVEAASRVLRSKWVTMGEEVASFEREFAAALDCEHAIATANGTLAIELCYRAAGLSAGDEIILPAITFVACFNAARLCGARVVLADVVSENDWTISPTDVAKKITKRTKLVVPMAHSGFAPNMQRLKEVCDRKRVAIIEDSCHGLLAAAPMQVDGVEKLQKLGTIGLAGTWSFFGNKNMTTGEGGMVTTNDTELANKIRLMRSHGITRSTWDRKEGHAFSYDISEIGTNARMDDLRAAIGRAQFRKMPEANERRARASQVLYERILEQKIEGLQVPFRNHPGVSAHHIFPVLIPEKADRVRVMESLREHGVQSSIHYPAVDRFSRTSEYFDNAGKADGLDVTRRIEGRILTLPLFPGLSEKQCKQIATSLKAAVR